MESSAGVAATDFDGIFGPAAVVGAREVSWIVEEEDVDVICVPEVAEPGEKGVLDGRYGRVV